MICGKCQREIEDNARFCVYCGTATGEKGVLQERTQECREGKNNTLRIAAVTILLGIVILAIGVYLSEKSRAKEPVEVTELQRDSNVVEYFAREGYPIITGMELTKRQTNKEEKSDFLYCSITAENEKIRKTGEYEIVSYYYDEGGWIVDSISEQSCYYEPLAEPDIREVQCDKNCVYTDGTDFDERVYEGSRSGFVYHTDADEVTAESILWPLENLDDVMHAEIWYSEKFSYPNFDVVERYVAEAFFDSETGVWKAEKNGFFYRVYENMKFEGSYIYRPGGVDSVGNGGCYDVVISNLDEIWGTAELQISGYIRDSFMGETEYIEVIQEGDSTVSIEDVRNLPEETESMVAKNFAGYFTPGSIEGAFGIKEYEYGILLVTQCSGLSRYNPEQIYNVYVFVGAENCYLGVKTTSNSNEYKRRILSKEV